MFRRLMALTAALAVAAAGWSLPTQAAPVSGSATLDIVFRPSPLYYAESGTKIDKIDVKLELDLILTLSVSGVDITSVSVFTFRGLEYQAFVFTGTIGALVANSQFIFAPNIIEIRAVRDALGLPAYCVDTADPAIANDQTVTLPNAQPPVLPLTGLPLCPYSATLDPLATAEHYFYMLIEGVDFVYGYLHPALRNLYLAGIMEAQITDPLGQPLTFRKKVAELSLSLAGLTIGLRGMFANIGSATTPAWRMGIVASVEGQTVSGITIRGESWLGARQGVECFAECKPLQIVRGGYVEDLFAFYEEKLFIRNLKLAGITFGARLEFEFFDAPAGLRFVELTQSFRLDPFRLEINNTLNIVGPDLTMVSDVFTTSLRVGDISMTVVGYIWPTYTGAFNLYWSQLISVFDPPGMKVTSVIAFCNEETVCNIFGSGLFYHTITLSGTVGDMAINISLALGNLFSAFQEAVIDLSWKVGNVTVNSGTILNVNFLRAQVFSINFKF
ncbi:MAG: hypothetical protein K6T71_01220 [Candidatus Bipolaricaulota bacterium]|nr:hypothetical protein [Candidatus Bipolaricaulota bacterium]